MKEKLYLAGPMTGLPDENRPAFDAMAYKLRMCGYSVINPVDLDADDDTPKELRTRAYYMKRDIPWLARCDAVAVLPGWENSYGSRLEVLNAVEFGMPVWEAESLVEPPAIRRPASTWPVYTSRLLLRPAQWEDETPKSTGGLSGDLRVTDESAGGLSGTHYGWSEVEDDLPRQRKYNAALNRVVEGVRQFTTGATRDTDENKLDYEGFLSPSVLRRYAEYMHKNRIQSDGSLRSSDNWQKGIPTTAYMQSAFRHFMEWWTAHRDGKGGSAQEAMCALMFNVMGYLHETLKVWEDQ